MERLLIQFLNAVTPVARRFFNRRRETPTLDWSIGEAVSPQPNASRGVVTLSPDVLRRHAYLLGASGSGKTKAMELLIRAHIQSGLGFCVVDPHGDLCRAVAAYLLAQSHSAEPGFLDRVYLIEPFTDEVAGMNVLDPGEAPLYPHISELIGIFRRLWASSWGPRMEQILRNALLVLARGGYTLVEVPQLLTDQAFRARVLQKVSDPVIQAYWNERFDLLTDTARLTCAEPVLNKIEALIADPRLRAMLGQREHCLDFRKLMDDGAWVLMNVSKGHLRDASYLLGSLATAQIQAAAMSRASVPEHERIPFTLFVDEFQNFRGEDFETILCEARKYGLRIVIAHQHLGQLDSGLQNAIFGNVATHLLFAVSPPDAGTLGRLLSGEDVKAESLVQLPTGQAVLHQRGQTARRVQIHPVLTPPAPEAELQAFMQALRQRHSRPLAEVQAEIAARAGKPSPNRKSRRPPRSKVMEPDQPTCTTTSTPEAGHPRSKSVSEAVDD